MLLYPEFPSTSAFLDTKESFGFVVIYSKALGDALKAKLDRLPRAIKSEWKLTADQKHLCKRIGLDLPFLPVDTVEEIRLFNKLALDHYETSSGNKKTLNYENMAIAWCEYVDGITIFPKLPVYLRSYQPSMDVSLFIKDSQAAFADQAKRLREVMSATSSLITPSSNSLSTMKNSSAHVETNNNTVVNPFFNVAQASKKVTSKTDHVSALNVVGTVQITSQTEEVVDRPAKSSKPPRAPRTCAYCRDICNDLRRAQSCEGRVGNKTCPHIPKTAVAGTGEEESDK
jgi:hypothetical protein